MAEVELVWVQQCEVCGREHRHMENHPVVNVEDADVETTAFRERCNNWYRAHVDAVQDRQAGFLRA